MSHPARQDEANWGRRGWVLDLVWRAGGPRATHMMTAAFPHPLAHAPPTQTDTPQALSLLHSATHLSGPAAATASAAAPAPAAAPSPSPAAAVAAAVPMPLSVLLAPPPPMRSAAYAGEGRKVMVSSSMGSRVAFSRAASRSTAAPTWRCCSRRQGRGGAGWQGSKAGPMSALGGRMGQWRAGERAKG